MRKLWDDFWLDQIDICAVLFAMALHNLLIVVIMISVQWWIKARSLELPFAALVGLTMFPILGLFYKALRGISNEP